ncbi:MAG TPA: VWA domain-containing protein [Pirellulaceae bacterium]|nr:VWA domain-containing protein [Pirellulaceae bacterium]HMO92425.1 VWA domain-containing protein [Pirellulaceae bacterium]HMP69544.1 VWA domain-containing protein [Pirellulaceae bacterium]
MSRQRKSRKGVSVVLVMAMLVPIAIISFFALSLANIQRHEAASQIASDLAAKYGANAIAREIEIEVIRERAEELARLNWTHGDFTDRHGGTDPSRVAVEIEFGVTRFGDGQVQFQPGGSPTNSIRVSTGVPAAIYSFGKPMGAVGVQASAAVANVERDICLVIDRSGSMTFDLQTHTWHADKSKHPQNKMAHSNDKFISARANEWWWAWPHPENSRWAEMMPAIYALANELNLTLQDELLSLVSYSSTVTEPRYDQDLIRKQFTSEEATIEATPTYNYYAVVRDFEDKYNKRVPVMGGTNIAAGIDLGRSVLSGPDSRNFAFKTMILMTDGQFNVGRDPWLAAQEASDIGIEVYTVTFSRDADIPSMERTAEFGKGKHFHAANGEQLREIFLEIANTPPGIFIE